MPTNIDIHLDNNGDKKNKEQWHKCSWCGQLFSRTDIIIMNHWCLPSYRRNNNDKVDWDEISECVECGHKASLIFLYSGSHECLKCPNPMDGSYVYRIRNSSGMVGGERGPWYDEPCNKKWKEKIYGKQNAGNAKDTLLSIPAPPVITCYACDLLIYYPYDLHDIQKCWENKIRSDFGNAKQNDGKQNQVQDSEDSGRQKEVDTGSQTGFQRIWQKLRKVYAMGFSNPYLSK